MRGAVALLGAGVALALAVASSSSARAAAAPRLPRRRWLLVGDSLAQGLEAGLRKRINAAGDELRAVSVVGTRAADWAGDTFAELLRDLSPDAVIVVLGTNDAAAASPQSFRTAASSIADDANRAGVPLAWVEPPPLPPRLAGAEAVRAVVRDVATRAIPSDRAVAGRARDGVHYSPAGYDAWAAQIWAALQSA